MIILSIMLYDFHLLKTNFLKILNLYRMILNNKIMFYYININSEKLIFISFFGHYFILE